MTEIIGVPTVGKEIDVKRFYIPGVTVRAECPECGAVHESDLGVDYLSYPELGKPEPVYFICEDGEDHYVEFDVEVIIGLTIVLARSDEETPLNPLGITHDLSGPR